MNNIENILASTDPYEMFSSMQRHIFETKCGNLEPYESYARRLTDGERFTILSFVFIAENTRGGCRNTFTIQAVTLQRRHSLPLRRSAHMQQQMLCERLKMIYSLMRQSPAMGRRDVIFFLIGKKKTTIGQSPFTKILIPQWGGAIQ